MLLHSLLSTHLLDVSSGSRWPRFFKLAPFRDISMCPIKVPYSLLNVDIIFEVLGKGGT